MPLRSLLLSLVLLAAVPAGARAAPPANDAPDHPGAFATFFAPDGTPKQQAAVADLAEATADPGVTPCVGDDTFTRTVWYLIPATANARELTVEGTGKTTDLVELAAFVQPGNGRNLAEPNACSGEGGGGSEATEDQTSAVSLRIPPARTVLVQVGRRGPIRSADDEQAVLSFVSTDLPATPRPEGDSALEAPAVAAPAFTVGGATLTEEDPAEPACPGRGSVWRDLGPAAGGTATVTVEGEAVEALTLVQGTAPTGENGVACVNRERTGSLQLAAVPVTQGQRLWLRLGTERPAATATARVIVAPGVSAAAPGGVGQPTPGTVPGAGGRSGAAPCVPQAQGTTTKTRTRVAMSRSARTQSVARGNRYRTFPVTVQITRGPACGARVDLVGPHGRVYARARYARVAGRQALRLKRLRRLVPGRYRLAVVAHDPKGRRVRLLTSVTPPLRIR